jgi:hypothetical protein
MGRERPRVDLWWQFPIGLVVGAFASLLLYNFAGQSSSPVVSIVTPVNLAQVSGGVLLQAQADGPGVSQLQFQVSGQNVGPLVTGGSCAYIWDSRTVSDGSHTINATWRNAQGLQSVSNTITVNVVNSPSGPVIRPGIR